MTQVLVLMLVACSAAFLKSNVWFLEKLSNSAIPTPGTPTTPTTPTVAPTPVEEVPAEENAFLF